MRSGRSISETLKILQKWPGKFGSVQPIIQALWEDEAEGFQVVFLSEQLTGLVRTCLKIKQ